jgi:hypothetical protein
MLTRSEIDRIRVTEEKLACVLKGEFGKVRATSAAGVSYNELVVKCVIAVLGGDNAQDTLEGLVTEARKWKDVPLHVVEEKFSQLPIRFGILSKVRDSIDDKDVENLIQVLETSADRLGEVLERRKPVTGSIGSGEFHYAVQPRELPEDLPKKSPEDSPPAAKK